MVLFDRLLFIKYKILFFFTLKSRDPLCSVYSYNTRSFYNIQLNIPSYWQQSLTNSHVTFCKPSRNHNPAFHFRFVESLLPLQYPSVRIALKSLRALSPQELWQSWRFLHISLHHFIYPILVYSFCRYIKINHLILPKKWVLFSKGLNTSCATKSWNQLISR